ncbi:YihY/virulence factor BrkB family protein [Pseudoflavonifractor sp. MSJ-37]|uniref:YihY/virulence factor BrkB family protein n=1 Tax=Pseudoflavonifractor sp. MSJ-37 TaxID=2841531 RepID=UPI001C0F9751|nr:YihY/virulence factor BrkB family protein [Pseudoflavonifractor sp. MSJ-37]
MREILRWSPVRFLTELVELYFAKRVSRSAAELAYFLILTFFPIVICINAFIGLLDLDPGRVLDAAGGLLPQESLGVLADYISYVSGGWSRQMLIGGLVTTLFASSAAFRALMDIMGDIYGRTSYQGVWQVLASVVCSLLLLATIYLSIVVLLTGEWLFRLAARLLPLPEVDLPWAWQWVRFLVLFCLVMGFVLLVYRISAPRGEPRPPVFTGAVLASGVLVGASAVFSWFIGMSSRYSLVYGSLASVIILLVWLYLCGNILILGNVFNYIWYAHRKRGREGPVG